MSEGELRKRKRNHHDNGARRIWRQYRFELIWLAAVGLGLFLLLERMNIRSSVARWSRESVAWLSTSSQQLDTVLAAILAQVSISNLIGILLIAGAGTAAVLRVRWRLLNSPALTAAVCPKCGGAIHRIHRRTSDHLISVFVPVRRYRCHNTECRWRGLRVGEHR